MYYCIVCLDAQTYIRKYIHLYIRLDSICIDAQTYIRKYIQVYIQLHMMHRCIDLNKKIHTSLYTAAYYAYDAQTYKRKYIQIYTQLHMMHFRKYIQVYVLLHRMHRCIDLYKKIHTTLYTVAYDEQMHLTLETLINFPGIELKIKLILRLTNRQDNTLISISTILKFQL